MHSFYLLCFILLLPIAALAHVDPRVDCLNNLRHLDGAKAMLALEHKLETGEPVESEMLIPYLSGRTMPQCLAGGQYTIGPIGAYPVCSISGHSEAAFRRDMERQAQNERILFWSLIASGTVVTAWITLAVLAARRRKRRYANNAVERTEASRSAHEANRTSSAAGPHR